jgi:tripartite-type tricarboxylate transporter receptor subunit TctC
VKARFAELGSVPFVATPAQMVAHVAAETEKWGRAVKFSGATVD